MATKTEQFFGFIDERHRIWHRRFVQKQSFPWTEDPLLRHYKFTNVYRELDRGTIYLWKEVAQEKNLADRLFVICAYRMLNNDRFFEWRPGGIPSSAKKLDYKKLKEQCDTYKLENGKLFNTAYRMLCNMPKGKKRAEGWIDALKWMKAHCEALAAKLIGTKTFEEMNEVLTEIPHVGEFLAYEIAIDLIGTDPDLGKKYTEDDWANIGPGARIGLSHIMGVPVAELDRNQERCLKQAQILRSLQHKHLPADYPGKTLTLRNIEHSLCEFGKYMSLKSRKGRSRPIYYPAAA